MKNKIMAALVVSTLMFGSMAPAPAHAGGVGDTVATTAVSIINFIGRKINDAKG